MTTETQHFRIHSQASLEKACGQLVDIFIEHRHMYIDVVPGKKRSIDQNRMFAARYRDLWIGCKFDSFDDARSFCKWELGMPILRRDSDGFDESFKRVFGGLSYEACIKLMSPNKLFKAGFPVTSVFNKTQGTEYIEKIAYEFPDVAFRDLEEGNARD